MTAADVEARFRQEMSGREVSIWANDGGYRYADHSHAYRKHLCCIEGSIVFRLAGGDVSMNPGDRLVIDAGVSHSAVVGAAGVRCAEAHDPS